MVFAERDGWNWVFHRLNPYGIKTAGEWREKLAKTMIWPWADIFLKTFNWFFSHLLTVGVKYNGNMIRTIQPNAEGFSWPSQQYNQIVEHSTSCLCFLYDTSPEKLCRRTSSRMESGPGSDISCRDPGGLEVLEPYFFLSETDSKIQSCILNPGRLTPESKVLDITLQGRLECMNCCVKQAGSSWWKML